MPKTLDGVRGFEHVSADDQPVAGLVDPAQSHRSGPMIVDGGLRPARPPKRRGGAWTPRSRRSGSGPARTRPETERRTTNVLSRPSRALKVATTLSAGIGWVGQSGHLVAELEPGIEHLAVVALPVPDLHPDGLVHELAPWAVSGVAGVVDHFVGQGERLVEPALVLVEVAQIAGEAAGAPKSSRARAVSRSSR